MIYLLVLLGFFFFASVAMTINEGLWSNTILLICILISGLVATAVGVPLGVMVLEQTGQGAANTWFYAFAGVWAAFSVSLLLMRLVVDKASRTRVRFLPIVDKIAGILMGLIVSVMLTSFAAYTLWNIPVKAGVWNAAKASPSQTKYFQLAVTPFHTVAKRFTDADGVDSSFVMK